ncbi:MAG TPA: PfkB family carbohydrate kinase [Thermomicrobiales bacterium]|nr:PfkB family carbohydrate kinase [Thermomicrobiales bacterium]
MEHRDGALDYLAVGHVTLDRQPDGSALPGGTVLFATLQAARLGLRAGIVTVGRAADLDAALAPYREEVTIALAPAAATTTFINVGLGAARRQTVPAWAGPLPRDTLPAARIVHLAPVAREIEPAHFAALPADGFLGATPQGWLRRWGPDGHVEAVPLDLPAHIFARLDALVLSEHEQPLATGAIAAVLARGGLVAVTRGELGCVLLGVAGREAGVAVHALRCPVVDDTGAGDVFAAAFFIALHEGQSPVAAARFANAAAGLSLNGHGVTAIAGRREIKRVVRETYGAVGA